MMPPRLRRMTDVKKSNSPGAQFRLAVAEEKPLQVAGAINAYTARLAQATGFRALYLSGGGVAANSLGLPDLGISTMEDVLTDVRRITAATSLPLLVDIDTGWGSAFNIARTIRSMIGAGAAAVHIEDQVGAKRCGHRPGKELVPAEEMVDRIKAKIAVRLGAGENRRDRYFIIPFAYQNRGNSPDFSHSFISVIRVLADEGQPRRTPGLKTRTYKNREFEAFTISWLPHDFDTNPHLCVFEGVGSRIFASRNTCPISPPAPMWSW